MRLQQDNILTDNQSRKTYSLAPDITKLQLHRFIRELQTGRRCVYGYEEMSESEKLVFDWFSCISDQAQIRLRLRRLQQREASNAPEKVRNDRSALKPNLFTGRTTEIKAIYRHWVYLAPSVATTSIHHQGISQISRKRLENHPRGHYFWIRCALNTNLL